MRRNIDYQGGFLLPDNCPALNAEKIECTIKGARSGRVIVLDNDKITRDGEVNALFISLSADETAIFSDNEILQIQFRWLSNGETGGSGIAEITIGKSIIGSEDT